LSIPSTIKENATFHIHKNGSLFIFLLIIMLISVPLFRTGVMIHDEVLYRMFGMIGFAQFFDFFSHASQNQGRPLAILHIPSFYAFIRLSLLIGFGFVRIILILANTFLFGWLIFRFFKNVNFAFLVVTLFLVFMPITFEHTPPNAYVTLFLVPSATLLISFHLYFLFLKKQKLSIIIMSMLLLFWSLTAYELFVFFVPLYFVIVIWFLGKSFTAMKAIKILWVPIVTTLLYLCAYFILSRAFLSQYYGTQFADTFSIANKTSIAFQLMEASFPGYYYLLNAKYQHMTYSMIFMATDSTFGQNNIIEIFINFLDLRLVLLLIILPPFLFKLLSNFSKDCEIQPVKMNFLALISGGAFMLLPVLPFTLSSRYQNTVNDHDFIALTGTFFTTYATIFVLSLIIWSISAFLKNKHITFVICLCLTILCIPVQFMNDLFSTEQKSNYVRMTVIEDLFMTNTIMNFQGKTFTAQNLFERRNALSFGDWHWSYFANNLSGIDVQLLNAPKGDSDNNIFFINDSMFIISSEEFIHVLSTKRLYGVKLTSGERMSNTHLVQIGEGKYAIGQFFPEYQQIDGAFKVYSFILSEGILIPVS